MRGSIGLSRGRLDSPLTAKRVGAVVAERRLHRRLHYRSSRTLPMYDWVGIDMAQKNAYLVILGTHVEEKLAIVRIVRSRVRRRLAELELAHVRRRKVIRRALQDPGRHLGELIERVKIRKAR